MSKFKSKESIKSFYTIFIGLLMKNGKYNVARVIINRVFEIVRRKTKLPFNVIILKAVLTLSSFVEVKQFKRYKKHSHQVPFPVSMKRKLYLCSKWIISSALEDKRKICFSEKLSNEIILLITNKCASKSYRKKKKNFDLAISNKSNAHFRW